MGVRRVPIAGAILFISAALAACGGGGGSGTPATVPTAAPSPSATPVILPTSTQTLGASGGTITFATVTGGLSGSIGVPGATSGNGVYTATLSAGAAGVPALLSRARFPQAVNPNAVLGYVTFTVSSPIAIPHSPAVTIGFPSAPSPYVYLAFYNGSSWQGAFMGPGTIAGTAVTFGANASPMAFTPGTTYAFALYQTTALVATPAPVAGANAAPAVGYLPAGGSTGSFSGQTSATAASALVVGVSSLNETGATAVSAQSAVTVAIAPGTATASRAVQPQSVLRGIESLPPANGAGEPDPLASFRKVKSQLRPASAARSLQSIRRVRSVPTALNATNDFYIQNGNAGSQTAGAYTTENATLMRKTAHADIWLDTSLVTNNTISSAGIDRIAADFENAFASDTAHFGSPYYTSSAATYATRYAACDNTGVSTGTTPGAIAPTQQMVVFVVDPARLGNKVGGYFDGTNYVSQAALNCYNHPNNGPLRSDPVYSNEVPMIYVGYFGSNVANGQTETYEVDEDLVRGTAHEFQHLLNFVSKGILVNGDGEDRWIDEGMSMLAQDLAVPLLFPNVSNDLLDAMGRAKQFLQAPQNYSITGFSGIDANASLAFNCSGCYGASFLFQRYMYDRFGGNAYLKAMYAGAATGLTHLTAVTGVDAPTLMGDFGIALAQSDTGKSADPRFNITGTPIRTSTVLPSQISGFGRSMPGPVAVSNVGVGQTSTYQSYLGGLFFLNVAAGGSVVTMSDSTGGYGLRAGIVQF